MRQNKDYKSAALSALKGNWAPSVLAVLVYVLAAAIFMGPYFGKSLSISGDPTDLAAAKGLFGLFSIYLVGILLVLGPIYIGLVNAFKGLLNTGENRMVSEEFRIGFGNWWHHVWGYFLKALFIGLWTMLLYIPGIIKSFSYAMTNYILVDYPQLSANQAIDLSRQMMKGHKFDLFYLYLSFIGWFLLSIITLGIGFLWLIPYIQACQAAFYQDVKAEWEAGRVTE